MEKGKKQQAEAQLKRGRGRPPKEDEDIFIRRLLSMTPEQDEYTRYMAKATGKTWTVFMRGMIDNNMKEHEKDYAAAKRFLKRFNDHVNSESEDNVE